MQKFIITSQGVFRYGDVRMHRDLLDASDVCIGGGRYEFDYVTNSLLLSDSSYDYGAPQWNRLDQLIMPLPLQGLNILYNNHPLPPHLTINYQ